MKQCFLTALVFCTTAAFGQANTKLSNLVSPTAVNQHLLPMATNTYDVGSSSYAFRNLYLRGYVYLDGTRFVSNAPGVTQYNSFLGSYAGNAITNGINNTGLGYKALYRITSTYANTAVGSFALDNNSTGHSNTALGTHALYSNTTGYVNTAIGDSALYSNTTAIQNVATGFRALYANTTESNNAAYGFSALLANTQVNNTAVGSVSLYANTTGYQNTAVGTSSLSSNISGANNTAVGAFTFYTNRTGSNNTVVGYQADVSQDGFVNATSIGSNAQATASNQVMLGSTYVTSVVAAGGYVIYSDGRFKSDVQANVPGLEFINALKPVTYHYKIHELNAYIKPPKMATESQVNVREKTGAPDLAMEAAITAKERKLYTGFVAQDVEMVAKKLNYEFSGLYSPQNDKDVYGLSYADFVVPLVKAVQQLDSAGKAKDERINQQQLQIDELTQRLNKLEAAQNGNNSLTLNSAYLEQNSPNPVSVTTTIRYHLPTNTTSAELNVTTTEGKLVKVIQLTSSSGQVNLNTNMLAAGTYNYTLVVNGGQVDTKRLIVTH